MRSFVSQDKEEGPWAGPLTSLSSDVNMRKARWGLACGPDWVFAEKEERERLCWSPLGPLWGLRFRGCTVGEMVAQDPERKHRW